MIIGKFYNGSGLGNMLHRYVATRVLALKRRTDYGMFYIDDGAGKEQGFKGKFFLEQPVLVTPSPNSFEEWTEKKVVEDGVDIRSYDPEWNFIKDGTLIEGEFQDERYWEEYETEVNEWLKVEPLNVPDDVCVINFRGGEFSVFPDLFLPQEYWDEGVKMMREINPDMKFEVHTDDIDMAQKFFPDFPVVRNIEINWRSMRYAKYAIVANTSFCILPRWLNKGLTIAPRYWARHNTHVWALPSNYYKRFTYI